MTGSGRCTWGWRKPGRSRLPPDLVSGKRTAFSLLREMEFLGLFVLWPCLSCLCGSLPRLSSWGVRPKTLLGLLPSGTPSGVLQALHLPWLWALGAGELDSTRLGGGRPGF